MFAPHSWQWGIDQKVLFSVKRSAPAALYYQVVAGWGGKVGDGGREPHCASALPPRPVPAIAGPRPEAGAPARSQGAGPSGVPVAWIRRCNNCRGRFRAVAGGGSWPSLSEEPEEERVRAPAGRPDRAKPASWPAPRPGGRALPQPRVPPRGSKSGGGWAAPPPSARAPRLTGPSSPSTQHTVILPSLVPVCGERCRFPTPCSARSRSTFPRSCRTS